MARTDSRRAEFGIEFLEERIALSAGTLPTVINTSQGSVARPNTVDRTSAQIRSTYIPPKKHASIFGLFVRPTASSSLVPRVVLAQGNQGKPLPLRLVGPPDQAIMTSRWHSPRLRKPGS